MTLASVADRIRSGSDLLAEARDFLDAVGHLSAEQVWALTVEEPVLIGDDHADALMAGLAEFVAARIGAPIPSWTSNPERFLERFWFVSEVPAFRAVAIAQSPISMKRRGIFWPARSLERV